ncbi:hypothetical protein HanPI659440_Chr17g0681921 [Helianthus annuus]|nr:hypothetical protein HanPI659440_Chr17g0681921 [Helianthus annuus]
MGVHVLHSEPVRLSTAVVTPANTKRKKSSCSICIIKLLVTFFWQIVGVDIRFLGMCITCGKIIIHEVLLVSIFLFTR